MKGKVKEAQETAEEALKENAKLEQEVNRLESKIEQLESQSRRDKLIFHGLKGDSAESWDDSESKVKDFITEQLGLNGDSVEFDRVHRLKTRGNGVAPIIAKFNKFKQRSEVLQAANNKLKKTDSCGVSQDFTQKVRESRRKLIPFMTEARQDEKKAYLAYDKLMIDKVKYVYNERTENIEPV
jgi:MFS superfamily sulfate permease-like transporter